VRISKPILVVAPNSTLFNWLKETNIWAKEWNSVVYYGGQDARKVIRRKEFYYQNKKVLSF